MIEKLKDNIYSVSENNFPQNSEELLDALKKIPPGDLIIPAPNLMGWSLEAMEPIVDHQHKQNKAIVWVISASSSNPFPPDWATVPTMQEALDYLQFEQMQRDLGF